MTRTMALIVLLLGFVGAARADCERDSDCKSGKVCQANKCVPKPRACNKDADCPGDDVCERSECVSPSGTATTPPQPRRDDGWGSSGSSGSSSGSSGWGSKPPASNNPPGWGNKPPPEAGMGLAYTAKTWPLSLVRRPLVLAPGMSEVAAGFVKDLSSDFGAPDGFIKHPLGFFLYGHYGVSDRIHVGVGNLNFCLADCGNITFESISFDGAYAYLANAVTNIVPEGSLFFTNNGDGVDFGIAPGLEAAFLMGDQLQIWVNPRFTFTFTNRDRSASPDSFTVTVQPRYELAPRFTLIPTLALFFPLEHLGSTAIPLGVGLHYAIDRGIDVLGDFTLGNLIPQDIGGGRSTGPFDFRTLRILGIFRF